MSSDIRLEENNKKFKFRVGGIVENEGKILIVQMNNNPFYCFPGGHIELYEDSKTAIMRELKEELYFDVEIDNLVTINENFYFLRGSNYHELCLYYFAHPVNKNIDMQEKLITEQDKFGTVAHKYKWIEKEKLISLDVKPKQVVEYIINNKNLTHFITKE